MAKKKLAIIDGKSIFYRGYYAMPNLSTKDGTPTGGVFGFTALSIELIKKFDPDYVVVAWDKPKTNIRKRLKVYPKYKAGRKSPPPDFYVQIPILRDLLEVLNWPLYEFDDYEADDIMHTLSIKADKAGLETMLITSDLDSLQSISDSTHVYALKKGFSNIEKFDVDHFEAKHGIKVEQFLDFKALKGDSSDNIPGVAGVGEKTATQLLQEFKTLDGIYDNLVLIKESVQKKLQSGKDSAYMSREVAQLYDDAPVELDLEAMDARNLDANALREKLVSLEFRTLARNLPDYMKTYKKGDMISDKFGIGSLPVDYIRASADLKRIKLSDEMAFDVMFEGSNGSNPVRVALAGRDKVYLIDVKKINTDDFKSFLQKVAANRVLGFNLKHSLKIFLNTQVGMPKVSHDLMIGAFLINPLRRERSLTDIAFSDVGYNGSGLEDLSPQEYDLIIGSKCAVFWKLKDLQSEQLSSNKSLNTLSEKIEWPIILVLAEMEYVGMKVNKGYLNKMSADLSTMIKNVESDIFSIAGEEFNIASPQQLSDILFVKLNLPVELSKKGKSGYYSTASDVLKKLSAYSPIVGFIEKYREYNKLKSTYTDALPKLIGVDGRIHTTFGLTTTSTGRLSSIEPNLQNIPVRTELGRAIRKAFVAEKGSILISADYSQFELRIAAALSNDETSIKAFNNNQDIHKLTASYVLGIDVSEVTKEMRYRAKAVNFGILYGQGPHALAEQTGMTFMEARQFIDKYFSVRPHLREMIDETRRKARDEGFVETIMGRRRPTPDVKSSNFAVREAAYRAAVNLPIQGSAADLTKLAMIKIRCRLSASSRILLQVHDSILIECKESEAGKVSEIMRETMENIYPELGVKLKVDVTTGRDWSLL